ncbi:MAG: hypothetical protein RL662_386 [Bacteroidota bacterium]|jgi:hypothetical protein
MPPNPLVTIYRGVKENAGKAYLRGEKGIVMRITVPMSKLIKSPNYEATYLL